MRSHCITVLYDQSAQQDRNDFFLEVNCSV